MVYYLYRFLNVNNDILYIGRTNDIKRRILKEHFTDNTHLPKECYLETEKVEYTEIEYESEEVAYEAILINRYRPKYNIQFKDEGKFDTNFPEFEWREFEWEYDRQLEFLKKKKNDVIKAADIVEYYISQSDVGIAVTGIEGIDYRVPILPQSFTLIAGVSGIGKTTYMLNIALRNARLGKKVLYINLKDSEENLFMRIISIDSGIPLKNLAMKLMDEQEWNPFIDCIKQFMNLDLLMYNKNEDYWKLEKIMTSSLQSNADLILIDDLQMIEYEKSNYVKDKMDYVLKSIRAVALKCSIPIIGSYCILKNQVINRTDHRPILTDLEYDSLFKYADNIQLMHRESFYSAQAEKSTTEIIVVKNMVDSKNFTQEVCCVNGVYAGIKNE